VYLHRSTVAHLLDPSKSPNSYASAVCGLGPSWPYLWRGTGSQSEHDRASQLATCARCEATLARWSLIGRKAVHHAEAEA
jgi:hypothetical protein